MELPVIIIGAQEIGLAALEIFQSNDVMVYGFLDDQKKLHGTEIFQVPVLGDPEDEGFTKVIGAKCGAFVAIEQVKARKLMVAMLLEIRKVMPVNAIHPRSFISKMSNIGHGNFVNAQVFIGASAEVGSHNIIQSNAILETGVKVGDYAHVGSGSILNQGVIVEDEVYIGTGVTVVSGVTIGKGARIGAGSVVMSDVKAGKTYFGVPAVEVKN